MADDPERLQRFQREARVIAALNHPNVVTIYSVEETDGVQFLTMELVEGKTLGALVPEGGLPLEELFGLALPLVDAVAATDDQDNDWNPVWSRPMSICCRWRSKLTADRIDHITNARVLIRSPAGTIPLAPARAIARRPARMEPR